ncbi:uncharacterized protein UTRI_02401 [Ustilago trichophora]|uniref:UV excision repair protein RAD23 n=1 Tax=Ustilago trichophora TaxID=86804 RepID=A0A5C3E7S7_9BASI|nr:uncharacterized protein UTRI_02401 [Ustilago trichophora]
MKLLIKSLAGGNFHLDAELTDTIGTIKSKIQQEQGHAPELQKIIFSGKILTDDKTVADCNIKEKDFLVVMVSKPKAPKPAAATPPPPPLLLRPLPHLLTSLQNPLLQTRTRSNSYCLVDRPLSSTAASTDAAPPLPPQNRAPPSPVKFRLIRQLPHRWSPGGCHSTLPTHRSSSPPRLPQLLAVRPLLLLLPLQVPLPAFLPPRNTKPAGRAGNLFEAAAAAQQAGRGGAAGAGAGAGAVLVPVAQQVCSARTTAVANNLLAGGAAGAGEEMELPTLAELSDEDRTSVEQIVAMGIPEAKAIESYFMCGKNVEMAVQYYLRILKISRINRRFTPQPEHRQERSDDERNS